MEQGLGPFLRRLRRERGLSQDKVARAANIGRVTLNRWEAGAQQPRALEMEALLAALSATVEARRRALEMLGRPRAREAATSGALEIGPAPHGGDLLRGLRARRGLEQDDAARLAGVSSRTLRRWERGEVWPSPSQLHALCYALGARQEELLALSSGHMGAHAHPEEPSEGLASMLEEWEQWQASYGNLCDERTEVLKELGHLGLAMRAWPLAARSKAGRRLLSEMYSGHAHYLMCYGRPTESGLYADRALQAWPRTEPPDSTQVRAAINAARARIHRGGRQAPSQGLAMLRPWLEVAGGPNYHAWILSDMALYTALDGDASGSLALSRRACEVAARCESPVELFNREIDEAQLLILAGQPRRALEVARKRRGELPPAPTVQFLLLEAHALARLGEAGPAHERLDEALRLIEHESLAYLKPQAHGMAERFRDEEQKISGS